jgi:hypothetical protein
VTAETTSAGGVAAWARRNRTMVIAGGAALLIVVVALLYLVLRDDDKKKSPPPLPSAGQQLDTGGVALASLLKSGRTVTYHAQYKSTADPNLSGGAVALEAWNTKGKSRADTTQRLKDGKVVHTASILTGKNAVACQQEQGKSWTCRRVPAPDEGDPAGLAASLIARLSGRSVTERADKVGDRDARCFKVAAAGAAEEVDVCVNKDGVLLRLTTAEASIEITKLDSSIPGSVFDAPASPSG